MAMTRFLRSSWKCWFFAPNWLRSTWPHCSASKTAWMIHRPPKSERPSIHHHLSILPASIRYTLDTSSAPTRRPGQNVLAEKTEAGWPSLWLLSRFTAALSLLTNAKVYGGFSVISVRPRHSIRNFGKSGWKMNCTALRRFWRQIFTVIIPLIFLPLPLLVGTKVRWLITSIFN